MYHLAHLFDQIHDIGQPRATSRSNAHPQKYVPFVSLALPQLLQVVHGLGADINDFLHHFIFDLCRRQHFTRWVHTMVADVFRVIIEGTTILQNSGNVRQAVASYGVFLYVQ